MSLEDEVRDLKRIVSELCRNTAGQWARHADGGGGSGGGGDGDIGWGIVSFGSGAIGDTPGACQVQLFTDFGGALLDSVKNYSPDVPPDGRAARVSHRGEDWIIDWWSCLPVTE